MNEKAAVARAQRPVMKGHLERLFNRCADTYRGGLLEIRCIHPSAHRHDPAARAQKRITARLFQTSKPGIEAAVSWAYQQNQELGFNTYVGVNPRKPGTALGRAASARDVEIAFFHFADFDTPECVEILRQRCPLAYRFAVLTGRIPNPRPHIYWELEEPTRNLDAWSQQQAQIATYFGSDRVIDPPRIMRLAGSVSYPDAKKQNRGYVVEQVALRDEEADERDLVTWQAVHSAFPPQASKPPADDKPAYSVPADSTAPRAGNAAGAGQSHSNRIDPADCLSAIAAGQDLHNNTRNVINHMVGGGYPDWVIAALLKAKLAPVSDGGTLGNVDHLLATARAVFQKPDAGASLRSARSMPEMLATRELPATPGLQEDKAREICAGSMRGVDPRAIKPRQWVINGRYIRQKVTLTVAPPGVGKSTLTLQEAIAIAAGIDFAGRETCTQGKVWIYNNEDDLEEIDRRIVGCAQHMGVAWEIIEANIHRNSGEQTPLLVAREDPRTGETILLPHVERCIEEIRKHKIDLFVVDPFLETHSVNENSNEAMNKVAGAFRYIAQQTNAAISLVHHSRKSQPGDAATHIGNADTARGAGSVAGVARVVDTLYPMTNKDAQRFAIADEEKHRYVRLDGAKSNLALVTGEAMWFRKTSQFVPYGPLGLRGDEVGVLTPVDLAQSSEQENARMDGYSELLRCAWPHLDADESVSFYALAKRMAWSQSTTLFHKYQTQTGTKKRATTTLIDRLKLACEAGVEWVSGGAYCTLKKTRDGKKLTRSSRGQG